MKKGFTLVELSIVLVIIGLLIGGVLAAQSMIESAKINAQVKQIQQIQIAVTNFNTSYDCLPGDCSKIGATGWAATGQPETVCAGNGDGKINGYNASANYSLADGNSAWETTGVHYLLCGMQSTEHLRVFEQLHSTGYYQWKYYDDSTLSVANTVGTAYPKMILAGNKTRSSGIGGVVVGYEPATSYIKDGHKIRIGACLADAAGTAGAGSTSFFCSPELKDMLALDTKMDDGKPYSGDVVITHAYYIYRVPGGLVQDDTSCCATSATNTYKITETGTLDVGLEVYMGF